MFHETKAPALPGFGVGEGQGRGERESARSPRPRPGEADPAGDRVVCEDCAEPEVIDGSELSPFTFLVAVLTGWLSERQAKILEFLQEENRVVRRQRGWKRLRLSDDERRRLAPKGVILRRKLLAEIATIVTPDTILRWHREMIAKKKSPRTP